VVERGVIAVYLTLAVGCRTPARDPVPAEFTVASTAASPTPEAVGSSIGLAMSRTVVGRALNVKGGAVVVDANGTKTWVDLPEEWPSSVVGRRVVVDGQLEKRAGLPLIRGTEPPVQGIVGNYWILTKVRYRQESEAPDKFMPIYERD
jgi:hypothetical protein